MKQVLIRHGRPIVEDVPAPKLEQDSLLVRVVHSCISTGTELSELKASGRPLWQRALHEPGLVTKGLRLFLNHGLARSSLTVADRLGRGRPVGYSAAGVVVDVGAEAEEFKLGDRVACVGTRYAYHAEIVRIPRNLAVRVPDQVDLASASTVALGAIALQGVRRAQPTLGETFVVIGLGIVGQLTAQILKANGCRVLGTDLDGARLQTALALGMTAALDPRDPATVEDVLRRTGAAGADGVIITAASPAHSIVSTAFQMCRKKARVVLVGDVGLHLRRADLYAKELDFLISTSYGPGRYDERYEEHGADYPVPYVRWTENRNMDAYLRLLADGTVKVAPLIGGDFPVDQAASAYAALQDHPQRPLVVLLSYPQTPEGTLIRTVPNPAVKAIPGRVRLAMIGAGEFARGTYLPILKTLSDQVYLHAVMSRTGHNAIATAKQFGARYATTDYQQVLDDPEVDAVLIATRHHLHATFALQALKAGKNVLVEKPLALTREDLTALTAFFARVTNGPPLPMLMTGFNRRFSPLVVKIRDLVQARTHPMILNYRMNAEHLPLDHWVHGEEGGGRNKGEACHIYDLFTYLTDSRATSVHAKPITTDRGYYSARDNFVTTLKFADGSLASLTYTSLGTQAHSKEQLEVFVDGLVLTLDDYRRLTVAGPHAATIKTRLEEKGHREELAAFARALRRSGEWPIPLWHQVQATDIALQVEDQIARG